MSVRWDYYWGQILKDIKEYLHSEIRRNKDQIKDFLFVNLIVLTHDDRMRKLNIYNIADC